MQKVLLPITIAMLAITIVLIACTCGHAETITIQNHCNCYSPTIDKAVNILQGVKDFTGMQVDVGNLKIIVEPSRAKILADYARFYPGSLKDKFSFYYFYTNTIYTYARTSIFDVGVTPPILAHEFQHAIQDHLIGRPWPSQSAEILPMWVDSNTRD